jgi:hypothetical protein
MQQYKYIKRFSELGINDVPQVGGKNVPRRDVPGALIGRRQDS